MHWFQGKALLEATGAERVADGIGALFLENQLPASDTVLFLSGRGGYELIQKYGAYDTVNRYFTPSES